MGKGLLVLPEQKHGAFIIQHGHVYVEICVVTLQNVQRRHVSCECFDRFLYGRVFIRLPMLFLLDEVHPGLILQYCRKVL